MSAVRPALKSKLVGPQMSDLPTFRTKNAGSSACSSRHPAGAGTMVLVSGYSPPHSSSRPPVAHPSPTLIREEGAMNYAVPKSPRHESLRTHWMGITIILTVAVINLAVALLAGKIRNP